jgi:hypothetical protein
MTARVQGADRPAAVPPIVERPLTRGQLRIERVGHHLNMMGCASIGIVPLLPFYGAIYASAEFGTAAIWATIVTTVVIWFGFLFPAAGVVITVLAERTGGWRAIGPGLMTLGGRSGRIELHLQMHCYPSLWETDDRARRLIVLERVLLSLQALRDEWAAGQLHRDIDVSIQSPMLSPGVMDELGFTVDTKAGKPGRLKRAVERHATRFLWVVGRRTPNRVSSEKWANVRWKMSDMANLNEEAVRERLKKVRALLARNKIATSIGATAACH